MITALTLIPNPIEPPMIVKIIINSEASEGNGKFPICPPKLMSNVLQRMYAMQKPKNVPIRRYLIIMMMDALNTMAHNSQKIYVNMRPINTSEDKYNIVNYDNQ